MEIPEIISFFCYFSCIIADYFPEYPGLLPMCLIRGSFSVKIHQMSKDIVIVENPKNTET